MNKKYIEIQREGSCESELFKEVKSNIHQPLRAARILRLPEVLQKTGCSRSFVYAQMKVKSFPQKVGLGARAVGWNEYQIDDWILNLPTKGICSK